MYHCCSTQAGLDSLNLFQLKQPASEITALASVALIRYNKPFEVLNAMIMGGKSVNHQQPQVSRMPPTTLGR